MVRGNLDVGRGDLDVVQVLEPQRIVSVEAGKDGAEEEPEIAELHAERCGLGMGERQVDVDALQPVQAELVEVKADRVQRVGTV